MATIYVSQSGQGTQDGETEANAHSVAWLNSGANWGAGASQVSPDDTVQLVDTISDDITLAGSGASGSPVTIDGTGATMAAGVAFIISQKSWWIVQNCTWVDNTTSQPFDIRGGSNGIVQGNHAAEMAAYVFLKFLQSGGLSTDMTIRNNYVSNQSANPGESQRDLIASEGNIRVIVEGNYFKMQSVGTSSSSHNDIIQTYEKGGSSAGPPQDWIIRHNMFVMDCLESQDKSWLMLEALAGTNEIYNNVFVGIDGAEAANGLNITRFQRTGVVLNLYNNTIVAKNAASNSLLTIGTDWDGADITARCVNNIMYAEGNQEMLGGSGESGLTRSYNLWDGTRSPSIVGKTGSLKDVDPLFEDYAGNEFSLQDTSPAKDTGTNLGAPYDTAIAAGATWPDPELVTRTTWSMGAYEAAGAPPAGDFALISVNDGEVYAGKTMVIACENAGTTEGPVTYGDVTQDTNNVDWQNETITVTDVDTTGLTVDAPHTLKCYKPV